MAGPVDYLLLTITHRTNEDWYLELPLAIPDLVGAVAVCQLKNKNGVVIDFDMTVTETAVILQAQSETFTGKSGKFSGDVLVTLVGGRDFVTHLINLDLHPGVSQRA